MRAKKLRICNIKRTHFKSAVFMLVTMALIFYTTHNVYAHKVNIFAFAEDGMVHAEGYFVDGSKCKNSLIEVFDEKTGKKIIEGYTDEEGRYSFKIPFVTSLKLVLNAGMGHKSEYTVTEEEVKDATEILNQKKEKVEPAQAEQSVKIKDLKNKIAHATELEEKTKVKEQKPTVEYISPENIAELEAIIDRVTDKKLQPVMRMLASLSERMERPDITEIIGGIGYIFGILGIILYFKSKNMIRHIQSKDKLQK